MRTRILLLCLTILSGCCSTRPAVVPDQVSSSADHPIHSVAESAVEAFPDDSELPESASPASAVSTESVTTVSVSKVVTDESDNGSSDKTIPSNPALQPQKSYPAQPLLESTTSPAIPINDLDGSLPVTLDQVIDSVHQSYPLVAAAYQERSLTNGNRIAAWGEFDTKLKAASENGPLGFYETYRNSAGIVKPLYGGGEVFGGYRIGDGSFQPWYKERETDESGELKAGLRVPLIRDRDIDARRAALWRATYDQQIADPVIRANLIQFSREAGFAYWKWVAAVKKFQLGEQWLEIAERRNQQVSRRVELQDLDPPELVDNQRLIAKRRAKLADSRRDVQQSAVKLSLFLRDVNGAPVVPTLDQVAEFPELRETSVDLIDADIQQAVQRRPELVALDLQWQQLRVDFAEACNLTRPGLDAQLVGSQDIGDPASKKRDKSEFELEAALFFEVPLERRKGLGKMQAARAKMAQVAAKRRLVRDKIGSEVQAAYAGLIQTRQEVEYAREAVALATEMANIERRKFEVGESDLLKVALREQYALEASEEVITATYGHFLAFTEYVATLAIDRPTLSP